MNQLAERLQKLRKENGYSQEQLADELQVSRQAVSKWECGTALPDTENLIALAKLYNCTMDDIVNEKAMGEQPDSSISEQLPISAVQSVEQASQPAADDLMAKCSTKKPREARSVIGVISTVTVFGSLIAYILCGALLNKWHPAWIVFLSIPVVPTTAESIIKRDMRIFCFPVFITAVYLLLGCMWGLWHPWWVVFFPHSRLLYRCRFCSSGGSSLGRRGCR